MNPRPSSLAPIRVLAMFVMLVSWQQGTAAETYALVVSGDPGRPVVKPESTLGDWSVNFSRWRDAWAKLLTDTYHIPAADLQLLRSPDPSAAAATSTTQIPSAELASRDHVLSALANLVHQSTADDQVLLVLIGHGYHSGTSGRFCLPGGDLSDTDLQDAFAKLACRELIVLVLAPDCRDIARSLSGPGRVIILGNIRTSAPYFSEFLLRALGRGGVPLLTAFNQASLDCIHWYQNQEWQEERKAWVVHGTQNQEIWRLFYPRGTMFAGDDQPHVIVNTNDPTKVDDIVGRRLIAEVAGLDDNGDGTVSTVYESGPVPTSLNGSAPADGALAATIILGKP